MAADTGRRGAWRGFGALRLPPLKLLSPLVARAFAGLAGALRVLSEVFSSRVTRLICAAGVLDAVLFFLLRPNVNDLWAARARASVEAMLRVKPNTRRLQREAA